MRVRVPRPGDVVRDALSNRGWTQAQLATVLGVSRYSVNQLCRHHRTITPEMAVRLAVALDTSAAFWLNLQRGVDIEIADWRLRAVLPQIRRRAQALAR